PLRRRPPTSPLFPTRRSSDLAATQDGSEHLLHRGLAIRADDGDQRRVEAQPPVLRQRAERKPGIVDHCDRQRKLAAVLAVDERRDRKSTRLNSSHVSISYAVF